MTTYRHTQTGYALIYPLMGAAIIAATIAVFSPATRVALILSIVLLVVGLLFWSLTIKVDNDSLRISFGPGLVRKNVPLGDIASCEPIRIRWWYGWGIHLTPYGWLYNVSGWDAVAITLRDGRRFSVGADQPSELTDAIRRFASER